MTTHESLSGTLVILSEACHTARVLYDKVAALRSTDRALARLQIELGGLGKEMDTLRGLAAVDPSTVETLGAHLARCKKLCREFTTAMDGYGVDARTGRKEWAAMPFRDGDTNQLIGTLARYKATISLVLGTITMDTKINTAQELDDYGNKINDVENYSRMRMQAIDKKLAKGPSPKVLEDLREERGIAESSVRICSVATNCLNALREGEPMFQGRAPETPEYLRSRFEAQLTSDETLDENPYNIAQLIGRHEARLEALRSKRDADHERYLIQQDINKLKACLKGYQEKSVQASNKKIHLFGEVVAGEDSDQIVVATVADLFDIKRAFAKDRATQVVGTMNDESLQKLSEDRYSSRFGGLPRGSPCGQWEYNEAPSSFDARMAGAYPISQSQVVGPLRAIASPPYEQGLPSEMRRRMEHEEVRI